MTIHRGFSGVWGRQAGALAIWLIHLPSAYFLLQGLMLKFTFNNIALISDSVASGDIQAT